MTTTPSSVNIRSVPGTDPHVAVATRLTPDGKEIQQVSVYAESADAPVPVVFAAVAPEKIANITISAGAYGVRAGASVTCYPTVPGLAIVKVSTSPVADCVADVEANNFLTGSARWQDWSTGVVAQDTSEVVYGNLSGVALIVSSGTWVLEVAK